MAVSGNSYFGLGAIPTRVIELEGAMPVEPAQDDVYAELTRELEERRTPDFDPDSGVEELGMATYAVRIRMQV